MRSHSEERITPRGDYQVLMNWRTMADPTPNRPLWEVMEASFLAGRNPGYCDRRGYAAELRAIAGEMCSRFFSSIEDNPVFYDWLLAEADRAEAGQ
jgi:hypothetical protein